METLLYKKYYIRMEYYIRVLLNYITFFKEAILPNFDLVYMCCSL